MSSTSNNKNISIIIVNFRSWKVLTKCLDSILKFDQQLFTYEVIVVDNYSDDRLIHEFLKKYKSIKFIENTSNKGFSNACNLGVKNSNSSFYLFLNPDTIVTEDAVLKLFMLSKNNPNYGIVSCNIINKKGLINKENKLFPNFFTLFGFLRFFYRIIIHKKLVEKFNSGKNIVYPDWVTGSVIFMSNIWYHKIGGWDEDFWMYYEDVAICKKVWENNGKVALTREAQIIHHHGGATRVNTKTIAITKSEVIISLHVYVNKHFKGLLKYLALILIVLNTLLLNFTLTLISSIFYFIPKLRVNNAIFINILKYYFNVVKYKTWLSQKSPNNIYAR